MAKVILFSTFPLPWSKIGSWTTMYRNYLSGDHQIDYVMCPEPQNRLPGVTYVIPSESLYTKIKRRFTDYKIGFVDAIEKLVQPGEQYIIQFVDAHRVAHRIDGILRKKGLRQNCYFQIFYHGYDPFLSEADAHFYDAFDEVVLLTHASYRAHLDFYTAFTPKVSILYNGIDTGKFTQIASEQKSELAKEFGLAGKKVFMWCAQDRPKKGLDIILETWRQINRKHENIELLIVGAKRDKPQKNVRFIGPIPNDELPKYYQVSDVYLFPTLCHEGFGLSLIEALNCGCHCIASAAGGVPEVLQNGKLGRLVQNPNYVYEWVDAIEEYLSGSDTPITIDQPMYSMQQWSDGMNRLISDAKETFDR